MIKIILLRILGVISLLFGVILVIWFIYNQFYPTDEFKSIIQLVLPIMFLIVGWKWFKYDGLGIEDTPPDFEYEELKISVIDAQKTLPYFITEVEKNVDGAYIKFPMDTSNQGVEHIWAYVHSYREDNFNVSLANAPYDIELESTGRRDVSEKDVEDWQIMLPEDKIKGAYSLMAIIHYWEKKDNKLSPKMQKQRAQLIDI